MMLYWIIYNPTRPMLSCQAHHTIDKIRICNNPAATKLRQMNDAQQRYKDNPKCL